MNSLGYYQVNGSESLPRKKFIQGMFDSIVPTYDFINRVLSMGIDIRWRKKLITMLGDVKGKRVLDICCGTGDLSRAIGEHGGKVTSLDFSMNMLKTGIRNQAITEAIAADAAHLPFKTDTFDAVTISFGIRNIPDLENFIQEVKRVLKPEGNFTILELTRPRHKIVRFVYNIYLRIALPLIGGIISGQHRAYRYLSRTIATFINPPSIEGMLEKYGFVLVNNHALTFSIATIISAKKQQVPGTAGNLLVNTKNSDYGNAMIH